MGIDVGNIIKKVADGADSVEIIATVVLASEHVYLVNVLGVKRVIRFTRHVARIVRMRRAAAKPKTAGEFRPETSALMMTLYGDTAKDGKPIKSVDDLTFL